MSFLAFKGAATYYYTVSEVIGQESTLDGQNIRVAGQVAPASIIRETLVSNTLNFILVDSDNSNKSPVGDLYRVVFRILLKKGMMLWLKGSLSSPGTFEAQQIIVKCPSKYEPEQKE